MNKFEFALTDKEVRELLAQRLTEAEFLNLMQQTGKYVVRPGQTTTREVNNARIRYQLKDGIVIGITMG